LVFNFAEVDTFGHKPVDALGSKASMPMTTLYFVAQADAPKWPCGGSPKLAQLACNTSCLKQTEWMTAEQMAIRAKQWPRGDHNELA